MSSFPQLHLKPVNNNKLELVVSRDPTAACCLFSERFHSGTETELRRPYDNKMIAARRPDSNALTVRNSRGQDWIPIFYDTSKKHTEERVSCRFLQTASIWSLKLAVGVRVHVVLMPLRWDVAKILC